MSPSSAPTTRMDLRSDTLPPARQSDDRQRVFIHPGQYHVAGPTVPTVISCMLGSCVEVCLWDRRMRVGGAVHYLMPGEVGVPSANSGVQGIADLVAAMQRLGSKVENIVAKIFGGACMLKELRGAHVGDRNVEIARKRLNELHIPVLLEHVGGERGRKIRFLPDVGETTVELI